MSLPQKAQIYAYARHLWPTRCSVCAAFAPIARTSLCDACRAASLWNRGPRCARCDAPQEPYWPRHKESQLCAPCALEPPAFEHLTTPLLFAGPLRLWLLDPKRRAKSSAPELAAWLLGDARVRALVSEAELVAVEQPGGLGNARGDDAAVELVRALAAQTAATLGPRLRRVLEAPGAEDAVHMPKFVVDTARRSLAGRRLVLVDVLVTSGRTMRAAAKALVEAGARPPWAVCVARVPP